MRVNRYRRRKPLPALVIVASLAITAATVWVRLIHHAANINSMVRCPSPVRVSESASESASEEVPLSYDALHAVEPSPPGDVSVRVLNAGGRRHLATQVTVQLQQLGFIISAPPANDPEYPQGNLECVGAILFGAGGESAARTLSLAVPCTELVRDDRQTDSVDLILGDYSSQLEPDSAARQVMRALNASPVAPVGGLQSAPGSARPISSRLLDNAHSRIC